MLTIASPDMALGVPMTPPAAGAPITIGERAPSADFGQALAQLLVSTAPAALTIGRQAPAGDGRIVPPDAGPAAAALDPAPDLAVLPDAPADPVVGEPKTGDAIVPDVDQADPSADPVLAWLVVPVAPVTTPAVAGRWSGRADGAPLRADPLDVGARAERLASDPVLDPLEGAARPDAAAALPPPQIISEQGRRGGLGHAAKAGGRDAAALAPLSSPVVEAWPSQTGKGSAQPMPAAVTAEPTPGRGGGYAAQPTADGKPLAGQDRDTVPPSAIQPSRTGSPLLAPPEGVASAALRPDAVTRASDRPGVVAPLQAANGPTEAIPTTEPATPAQVALAVARTAGPVVQAAAPMPQREAAGAIHLPIDPDPDARASGGIPRVLAIPADTKPPGTFAPATAAPPIDLVLRREDQSRPLTDGAPALGLTTGPAAPLAPVQQAAGPGIDLTRDPGLQRMIDRIEILRDAADARDTRIRLIPDALGPVEISVRREGDGVHVHFTASEAATRQLIADAQPRLAELAEQRGVRLDRATVDAGPGQAGGQTDSQRGGEPGQPRSQHQQPAPPRTPGRTARVATDIHDERIA